MTEELSGIDLGALAAQTEAFLAATEASYEATRRAAAASRDRHGLRRARSAPTWRRSSARRRWTRVPGGAAPAHLRGDARGPRASRTAAPGNVILDAEPRPKKTPRAFCAPVRVPEEVYLVLTRIGGREDYETLMHEAGHAEHFSHVDPALPGRAPLPRRQLGHRGLRVPLPAPDRGPRVARAPARGRRSRSRSSSRRARRSSSTCGATARSSAYELELQGEGDGRRAGRALRAAAVRGGARRLAARELAQRRRPVLLLRGVPARVGARDAPAPRAAASASASSGSRIRRAGELLRELWSAGQREPAHELLRRLTGAELDFSALLD